jgi:hypothetical protein
MLLFTVGCVIVSIVYIRQQEILRQLAELQSVSDTASPQTAGYYPQVNLGRLLVRRVHDAFPSNQRLVVACLYLQLLKDPEEGTKSRLKRSVHLERLEQCNCDQGIKGNLTEYVKIKKNCLAADFPLAIRLK